MLECNPGNDCQEAEKEIEIAAEAGNYLAMERRSESHIELSFSNFKTTKFYAPLAIAALLDYSRFIAGPVMQIGD
ncbi:hypothetical protein [Novosphingobium sp. KN65.2]|uniref:hypothetical protein n=1 Tax=Novosphingobium sp. KN65.2 TaxID=1478134 RepID=UPI0005DFA095|nr:hypothetical protein [Novosphingobium sp. KN65.2]CDO35410.1 hypothetical protein SPHV1_2250011 [Novosphingobium sp. KN65.2]